LKQKRSIPFTPSCGSVLIVSLSALCPKSVWQRGLAHVSLCCLSTCTQDWEPDTFYVKIDDDIVYIQDGAIEALVEEKLRDRWEVRGFRVEGLGPGISCRARAVPCMPMAWAGHLLHANHSHYWSKDLLCMAAKLGPNLPFYMPNRTNCTLLVSLVADHKPDAAGVGLTDGPVLTSAQLTDSPVPTRANVMDALC
jgi:hypothetical protein